MKYRRLFICCLIMFILTLSASKITIKNINIETSKSFNSDSKVNINEPIVNEVKEEIKENVINSNVVTSTSLVTTKIEVELKKEKITTVKNSTTSTTKIVNNTTEKVVEPSKSLKEKNVELINDIKNIYGYDVSYNDEEFWFGGVASTKLMDEEKANKALTEIKNKSSVFPEGFFRAFQGYNGFRIILFEHIEGAAGVASYEFGDDNFIAIDVNSGFLSRVFYHETFHIMEQYINYKSYGKTNPFDNWNNNNPVGFSYNSDDSYKYTVYDYNDYYSYDNPSEISFVSIYAKSSPREDRAELFADMMFRAIKKDYMNNKYGVNNKAKALSLILRDYFPNSNGAKWETFIDWN